MTREDAFNLVDYHYWARDRILDAVEVLTPEQYSKDLASSFTSVRATLVARVRRRMELVFTMGRDIADGLSGRDVVPGPGDDSRRHGRSRSTSSGCSSAHLHRRTSWIVCCATARSMARRWSLSFSQMLQHVVNHATYHRGQVTTMLRQLGAPAPKPQDLIRFYRDRASRVHLILHHHEDTHVRQTTKTRSRRSVQRRRERDAATRSTVASTTESVRIVEEWLREIPERAVCEIGLENRCGTCHREITRGDRRYQFELLCVWSFIVDVRVPAALTTAFSPFGSR